MQGYDEYFDLFCRVRDNHNLLTAAIKEAKNQDLYIVQPNFGAKETELDLAYEKFMSMTKPFRRRADWITLEYFGMTNQTIYDISKLECLRYRVPDIVMNNSVGSGDIPVLESNNEILTEIINFNKKCNKFHYGLARNGKVPPDKTINTSFNDYDKLYKVADPATFEKQNGGICWDFVAYEAKYFQNKFPSVPTKAYYVVWDKEPDYPTHTFLCFNIDSIWYHFESSFSKIKGIWKSDKINDHISHVLQNMGIDPKYRYEVREYNPLDTKTYGMNSNEYMNYMNTQKKLNVPYNSKSIPVKITSSNINESYVAASDDINMDDLITKVTINRDMLDTQGMYWENETGFILLPCHIYTNVDSLDRMWEAFNLMILKHRRVSDWKCQELYGFTNQKYYEWLKAKLLKAEPVQQNTPINIYEFYTIRNYISKLIESDDTTRLDLAENLVNLSGLVDTYDGIISGDIISDAIDKYDGLTNNLATIDLTMNDLPPYTPDEMIDMGVNSMNQTNAEDIGLAGQWFNEYREYFNTGIKTEEFIKLNKERIHKLEEMHEFNNYDRKAMLELGWDSNFKFTPTNRTLADRRIHAILSERMNTTQIIDISDLEINESTIDNIDPIDKFKDKRPIFIALEEGKSLVSPLIRKKTGSVYSHCLLSFDPSMEQMYSYGVYGSGKKDLRGGFTIESIKDKNKDKSSKFKVYAIFVNNKTFDKIKTNVQWFIEHQKQTMYSWAKLFKYVFHIKSDPTKPNMICSEFVDKILKMADIDITNMDSSFVAPSDIDKIYKRASKIYTVYNDTLGNYSAKRINSLLNRLFNTAKMYTEANISIFNENTFMSYTRQNIRNIDMLRELSKIYINENNNLHLNSNISTIYTRLISPSLYLEEDTYSKIKSNNIITLDLIKPID